jgi:hypothetical protein
VRKETEHKKESQVMGVPEDLKALLADLLVSGRVHQEHNKQHEVSSDATRLSIVDLLSSLFADLSTLDVDKIDVVSCRMKHSPESHRVGNLTVEPNVFIRWEEPGQLGSDDSDYVSQHWDENQAAVISQD